MSFNDDVKNEILKKAPESKNLKYAFLSGLLRAQSSILQVDGFYALEFSCANAVVADYVVKELYNEFSVTANTQYEEDILNKKYRYFVTYNEKDSLTVLEKLDIVKITQNQILLNTDLSEQMSGNNESKRAFIQGTFLGAGSCTVPTKTSSKKTAFHLEIVFSRHDTATAFATLLCEFDIFASVIARKEQFVVYLKSWEEITDFLVLLSATASLSQAVEIKAQRDKNNQANRMANCDIANINKQTHAIEKQLEEIDLIERTTGLESLDEQLFLTATARRENPFDSMMELAEKMGVSKSGINHRFRKIAEIAKNLRNE